MINKITDKQVESITLELTQIDPQSIHSFDKLKDCAALLTEAYVPIEKQFAKQFPDAIAQDKFLNVLMPLFKNGIDNAKWDLAEEKIRTILMNLFEEDFAKNMSANEDISSDYEHLIVTARNKNTKALLGMIYFFISKENPQTNARVPIFGISPKSQNKGLGKLLMSSILCKFSNIQKISLSTRVSNDNALTAYRNWGFTQTQNTMEYWVNMEYDTTKSNVLQNSLY